MSMTDEQFLHWKRKFKREMSDGDASTSNKTRLENAKEENSTFNEARVENVKLLARGPVLLYDKYEIYDDPRDVSTSNKTRLENTKGESLTFNEARVENVKLLTRGPKLLYDKYEIYDDPGLHLTKEKEEYFFVWPPEIWPEEKYLDRLSKMTPVQRRLLQKFEDAFRSESPPLRRFVQAPWTNGRFFFLQLLEQCAYRNFPSDDPSSPVVVKMAPTDKTACNISGLKIRSALKIQGSVKTIEPLSPSDLKEYARHYQNCRLLIVDEISMVGQNLLYAVSERLKQIKGVDDYFGGVHVLVLGDTNQLPPVGDVALSKKSRIPRFNFVKLFPEEKFTEPMPDVPHALLSGIKKSGE